MRQNRLSRLRRRNRSLSPHHSSRRQSRSRENHQRKIQPLPPPKNLRQKSLYQINNRFSNIQSTNKQKKAPGNYSSSNFKKRKSYSQISDSKAEAKSYVTQIKNAKNFKTVKDLYKKAHAKFPGDRFIITIFIHKAGEFAHFSEAKKAYTEVEKKQLSDVVIYNAFINVAGKNGEFAEAEAAFKRAVEAKEVDVKTYNTFIHAAGKNGEFEKAEAAFKEAKDKHKASVITYNSFIDAARKNGEFEKAEVAFDEAKNKNIANIRTYNSFIDTAGKNGDFKKAEAAFEEMKSKDKADIITYTSFIDVAAKNGEFEKAEAAFMEAKKKNIDDAYTYNSIINAAGKNGKFAKAEAAFMEAKKKNMDDAYTYTSFIDAAGKNGEFEKAEAAFKKAKEKNIDVACTYNSIINAAGKNGEFEKAEAAFDEAKNKNIANICTYTSFIDVAGKNGEFEKAEAAFEEAKNKGKVDVYTYTSFIDAAGKNGEFEKAEAAFMEAKNKGKTDVITYTSFINAARLAEAFGLALSTYKEACNLYHTDQVITFVYLKLCRDMGKYEEAITLYSKSQLSRALPENKLKSSILMMQIALLQATKNFKKETLATAVEMGATARQLFESTKSLLEEDQRKLCLIRLALHYDKLVQLIKAHPNQVKKVNKEVLDEVATITEKCLEALRAYFLTSSISPSWSAFELLKQYYPNDSALWGKYQQTQDKRAVQKIKIRAYEKLKHDLEILPTSRKISVDTLNIWGNPVGRYSLNSSVYCEITGDELPMYRMVNLGCPMAAEKIPMFISDSKYNYRLDVMGGPKLKSQVSQNKFGSFFAVPTVAQHFVQSLMTSQESFYYAQRALAPEEPNKNTLGLKGSFHLRLTPDALKQTALPPFITQDGCGFIKASLAKKMGIETSLREPVCTHLTYQATHHYVAEQNQGAVEELEQLGKKQVKKAWSNPTDLQQRKFLYYGLAAGLPSLMATGLPVAGDQIILPASWNWSPQNLLLGRNPYNSPLLQAVDSKQIAIDSQLDQLTALQYTLTGYRQSDKNKAPVFEFYKGILIVVSDECMKDSDLCLSAKDKKLCDLWQSLADKNNDHLPERIQDLKLNGVLVIKKVIFPGQLFGLPIPLAKAMGGDYDGDEYNLVSSKDLPNMHRLVKETNKTQPINVKIEKTFTPTNEESNYQKILQIRGNALERWSVISCVVQALSMKRREELANAMHPFGLLLDSKQEDEKIDKCRLMQEEIRLGIKYGKMVLKRVFLMAKSLNERKPMRRNFASGTRKWWSLMARVYSDACSRLTVNTN